MSEDIDIEQADLGRDSHRQAIIALLDMYSRDTMGAGAPLPAAVRERLIEALARRADALILLARAGDDYVGLCIGFEGFSTFRAQPLLNIHDIAVHPDYRDRGIGRRLAKIKASGEVASNRQGSRGCAIFSLMRILHQIYSASAL